MNLQELQSKMEQLLDEQLFRDKIVLDKVQQHMLQAKMEQIHTRPAGWGKLWVWRVTDVMLSLQT